MTNSTWAALRWPPPAWPGPTPDRSAPRSEQCTGGVQGRPGAGSWLARVFRAESRLAIGRATGLFLLLGVAGLVPGVAGCGGGVPSTPLSSLPVEPNPDGTTRTVVADWDDLAAAMDYAQTWAECAYVRADRPPGDAVVRFELLTIDEKSGTLEVRREGPTGPKTGTGDPPPQPITITARIGPAGDRRREARLVEALASRLEALRGKAYAPIAAPLGWGS